MKKFSWKKISDNVHGLYLLFIVAAIAYFALRYVLPALVNWLSR